MTKPSLKDAQVGGYVDVRLRVKDRTGHSVVIAGGPLAQIAMFDDDLGEDIEILAIHPPKPKPLAVGDRVLVGIDKRPAVVLAIGERRSFVRYYDGSEFAPTNSVIERTP